MIDRAESLDSRLHDIHLDGAVVALPQHVYYFTGHRPGAWGTGHKPIPWGYWFFVLGPNKRLLVAPLSEEQLSDTLRPGVVAFSYDANSSERVINEREAANAALGQAVLEAGLRGKRIGVEAADLGFGFVQEIQKVADVAPLDDLIEAMRLQKDDEELSLLRRTARIFDNGFEAARQAVRPGVSELEVYAAIHRAIVLENKEPFVFDAVFASGVNTAGRLGPATDRVVSEGEHLLVDLYPGLQMYKADLARIFVAGKPLEWQLKMHAVLEEAMSLVAQSLMPGVPASEPDAIVRRCIADAGYGDHIAHHAGHGLGLLHPERPYIAPWDEMELTERMVLSIEPGIYISGLGGMRIEQNFIVWADGAEPTSQFPLQLSASG